MDDINACSQRYQENVDASKAAISKFDPLKYLFDVQTKLNNLMMCERQAKCRCKTKTECVCDSDDFVEVTSTKFELGSNCAFLCEFQLSKDISKIRNFKTTLRFFAMDEKNNETVWIDILRSKHQVRFQNVSFELMDDLYIQNNVLTIRLNYMSYTKKKSKC